MRLAKQPINMLQEKEQVETAIKDVTQQEAAKHIITKSDKIIVFTGSVRQSHT